MQAELSAAQERERLLNEKKSQLKETIRNLDLEKQRCDSRAKAAENGRSDTQNRLNKERQFPASLHVLFPRPHSWSISIYRRRTISFSTSGHRFDLNNTDSSSSSGAGR